MKVLNRLFVYVFTGVMILTLAACTLPVAGGGQTPTETPDAATATTMPSETSQPTATQDPPATQTPAPTAVDPTATPANSDSAERIQFASGATSATVTGQLPVSGMQRYVVRAEKGQTLNVDVSASQGAAILVVFGADGTVLISDHAEATHFEGVLPSTQDYNIDVKGGPDGANAYSLTVTIPPLTSQAERITFASGATSASVAGQLVASGMQQYVVKAEQGQTLNVDLSFTQGKALLVIWGADGTVLQTDHVEVTNFSGVLPSTQDYNIKVVGYPDGPTTYNMTVTIPPLTSQAERITFASGATSASVAGHLAASGVQHYVVRAEQGQTLNVDLSFTQGKALLVIWGADGTVLQTDHVEVTNFSGGLPSTQDYNIDVRGYPDGPTDYSMTVTIPPAS